MPEQISVKDFLKHFKAGAWGSQEEAAALLAASPRPVDARTIVEMLDALLNKRLASDPLVHGLRCGIFEKVAAELSDKSLFSHYAKALRGADSRLRKVLVLLLPGVDAPDEHDKLAALLKVDQPEVRLAAGSVLLKVGGKSALQAVGKLLEDPKLPGAAEAIDLVAKLGGHYAIPFLELVLGPNRPPPLKIKVLRYLGDAQLMAKAASQALRSITLALGDASDKVGIQAISSFCDLCSEEAYFEYIAPFLDHDDLAIAKAADLRGSLGLP